MENLPSFISIVFVIITVGTILFLYGAAYKSKFVLAIVLIWLALQSAISFSGFYTVTDTIPPRFLLLILPPLILILALFLTSKGQRFIDRLDLKTLTLLHIVRVPVELVLFWLCMYKTIPGLMTFEGRNFDILSGITAPFIYYFGFVRKTLSKKFILTWNVICLALLINIVVNAILSAPSPFQKFAFEQPNVAVLHFPFVLLPGLIVPIVLLSHLAAIRQLLARKDR